MGPEFVPQIREIVTELENDDDVKVVVFESAVGGFFLNHSDFLANFEDLTGIPQGPTGLEAWPDAQATRGAGKNQGPPRAASACAPPTSSRSCNRRGPSIPSSPSRAVDTPRWAAACRSPARAG